MNDNYLTFFLNYDIVHTCTIDYLCIDFISDNSLMSFNDLLEESFGCPVEMLMQLPAQIT